MIFQFILFLNTIKPANYSFVCNGCCWKYCRHMSTCILIAAAVAGGAALAGLSTAHAVSAAAVAVVMTLRLYCVDGAFVCN